VQKARDVEKTGLPRALNWCKNIKGNILIVMGRGINKFLKRK